MSRGVILNLLVLLGTSTLAYAGEPDWHSCFAHWENKYQLPHLSLKAIAKTESNFNPEAYHKNKNGTEDIGVMQINSSHLKKLKKYDIPRKKLWDPCTNIQVGAWLLWDAITRHGSTWKAIGVYHSPTLKYQEKYVPKVAANWKKMMASER